MKKTKGVRNQKIISINHTKYKYNITSSDHDHLIQTKPLRGMMAIQLPSSSVACFSFSLGLSVRHRENEKPSWNVLRGRMQRAT